VLGEEVGGVPADDDATAVHGRRSGALAEDDDGPRGEGAGPSRTTAGRSWRSAVALLEDGGVVGGAAAVGEDGGARWEIMAA
jgi:hypothetical protein